MPAMIRIGAASPIARLMARIEPVMMPGMAEGSVMRLIICHRVAPRASAPSRSELGTARSASCDEMITIGQDHQHERESAGEHAAAERELEVVPVLAAARS